MTFSIVSAGSTSNVIVFPVRVFTKIYMLIYWWLLIIWSLINCLMDWFLWDFNSNKINFYQVDLWLSGLRKWLKSLFQNFKAIKRFSLIESNWQNQFSVCVDSHKTLVEHGTTQISSSHQARLRILVRLVQMCWDCSKASSKKT